MWRARWRETRVKHSESELLKHPSDQKKPKGDLEVGSRSRNQASNVVFFFLRVCVKISK